MISDVLSGTTVAAIPILAMLFGVSVVNVAVLAALAALGALFDPAGITARAVDAAGGGRACRLDA